MREIKRVPIFGKLAEELKNKQKKVNINQKKEWKLSKVQSNSIFGKLLKSQGHLCCYCECRISKDNAHIEHFIERSDNIDRIYDYSNMLLSCEGDKNDKNKKTTCGHIKSKENHNKEKINYDLLLNPSSDKTSELFSYIDGYISPKKTCSKPEIKKVKYTISRLALDSQKLNNRRITEIIQVNKVLRELGGNEKIKVIKQLLNDKKIEIQPYFSTIKDNFSHVVN